MCGSSTHGRQMRSMLKNRQHRHRIVESIRRALTLTRSLDPRGLPWLAARRIEACTVAKTGARPRGFASAVLVVLLLLVPRRCCCGAPTAGADMSERETGATTTVPGHDDRDSPASHPGQLAGPAGQTGQGIFYGAMMSGIIRRAALEVGSETTGRKER